MTLVYYFGDLQKLPEVEIQCIKNEGKLYDLKRIVIDDIYLQEESKDQKKEKERLEEIRKIPFIDKISIGNGFTILADNCNNLYGYGKTSDGELGGFKQKLEDNRNKYQFDRTKYIQKVVRLARPEPELNVKSIADVYSGNAQVIVQTTDNCHYIWGKNTLYDQYCVEST